MDSISFSCIDSLLDDYVTTGIYINGIDLRVLIERIEYWQFKERGFRMSNGYEGISFFIAFHNQNHFLLKTLSDYIYEDCRYTLYDYEFSGVPGDHSLACKIKVESDKVIWYDFKNYSKIIPFQIDYEGLQFEFSFDQYCDAINNIRNSKEENMFA